ncbi:MAG: hypothetical protein AAGI23_21680 [Bacteroidota bacterium]
MIDLVEEDIDQQEMLKLLDNGGAFDYLQDEREDIYTDADLKKKY